MRGPLLAVAGAVVAAIIAAAAAWGFVMWRAGEQEARFAAHAQSCFEGTQAACDSLRTACEKRSGIACGALAARYLEGRGVPVDAPEGLRLIDEGCKNQHGPSCLRSARERQKTGLEPERANEALRRACTLGEKAACTKSGG